MPRITDDGGDGMPPPSPLVLASKARRVWVTELTPELVEEFVKLAPELASKRHTALTLCVQPQLFDWWLDNGMRPDAPPLMQELAVRFNQARSARIVEIRGGLANSPNDECRLGTIERLEGVQPERENTAPDQSLETRKQQMIAALRDPSSEMAQVLSDALDGDSPLKALIAGLLGEKS